MLAVGIFRKVFYVCAFGGESGAAADPRALLGGQRQAPGGPFEH